MAGTSASSPIQSHPSSRLSRSEEDGEAQQSGRSPTYLHAEQVAASLELAEAGRATLSRSMSTPTLSSEPITGTNENKSADGSLSFLSSPYQRHSLNAHAPSISSPLNPNRSSTSIDDNSDADKTRRASDGSAESATRPETFLRVPSTRRRPPPQQPIRQAIRRSTSELAAELGLWRGDSPLHVRDVGSEYTRFFNPFTDSARNSFVETRRAPWPLSNDTSRATTPLSTADTANPFATPNASATKLSAVPLSEKSGFFLDERLGASYGEKSTLAWPLITDKEEDDDDLHLPHPDDEARFQVKWREHFKRENLPSTLGLFAMALGLTFIFIALPVLSVSGVIDYNSAYVTPLDEMPNYWPKAEEWAIVNDRTYPLFKNIRSGLIDPDTPKKAMTKTGAFGDDYVLVFSDEFNQNNRTFYEGDDPYFYAPDIWYGATQDLEWFDPDAVTTWDGTLELRLDKFQNHGVDYRSGMLNSWNQLCFKGGIFEVSVSLPGPAAVMGLWPGAWTMGNLGRPGYLSTTEGLWPYTYQACDVGITPNQSSHDGLSRLPGQKLNSCTCKGEDHPTPGTGRGAPEIDIIEAGASYGGLPIATQSYQVAPFDIWWYPDYEFTAFPDYTISFPNGYTGGPFQQALSATTNLNKDWYDGQAYQKYSFEYAPGTGEDGYIVWKVGDQVTWQLDGRAVGPNGNIKARQISEEPMSLILNLGFSHAWTEIDFAHLVFPTVMRVDYVRWYQKKGQEMVTCDPPGFETTKYIKNHPKAYTNPNLTKWDDTGYGWPKHQLNSNCKS